MRITIGTFNLNNLFSRYNFSGEIKAIKSNDTEIDSKVEYVFEEEENYRIRTYKGKLVKGKPDDERETIAERINRMDVDVLAVQEVEDIDILKRFNREKKYGLDGLYKYQVLVEGNDDRLIDIRILSKLPIGAITSQKEAVHPLDPTIPVFGRDLLEVEIWDNNRKHKLFTVYNNHLKSHYVPWWENKRTGKMKNNKRREKQAEVIAHIVKARMRPNSRFIILGDMNDPPDSQWLAPFINDEDLSLTNALTNPKETRPSKADKFPPSSKAWTHRFKPSKKPTEYKLYDQIWISPSLKDKQIAQKIDRRTKHKGDGSDHDPAWIELDL